MVLAEIWKPIDEFEGYEVSNYGVVVRVDGDLRTMRPQYLAAARGFSEGYYFVSFSVDGKQHRRYVHRLVLTAFVSPPPFPKAQVNHKDGNKKNNFVGNLEWVTQNQNMKHAWDNGLMVARAPVLFDELHDIVEMIKNGKTHKEIADHYAVTASQVKGVLKSTGTEKPNRLDKRNQEIIRLRDEEKLTFDEIASQLGITFWQAYRSYQKRETRGKDLPL